MEDLRYPIGQFQFDGAISWEQVQAWIHELGQCPGALRQAVAGLSAEQLDTPYRPGGWTVRQVVHHLPDAHLLNYARYRWTLTEEQPAIPAWNKDRWAALPDAQWGPTEVSLTLLESIHLRWDLLLRAMSPQDFARSFYHPTRGLMTLEMALGIYAWHGRHHVAHITALRTRMGW
ncbi:MAG: putative metal-dependent hydrolase yfiT [Symbiobacteriaceae bacterium]|nr:putative metal-dependent hydrolase yfiT [Symbiobacteriaceae bacterium]